ncbi:hypothetical protein ACSNOI_46965, partial [Actinomadura kijaniata]|uniref:hypothetical protein n=1 Tax=Actinomadura kijaniata TaxID=46161 RepID=UPI003F195C7A
AGAATFTAAAARVVDSRTAGNLHMRDPLERGTFERIVTAGGHCQVAVVLSQMGSQAHVQPSVTGDHRI